MSAGIGELEQKQIELRQKLQDANRKLREAETDLQSLVNWTKQLNDLHEALTGSEAVEVRLALRSHLRELIVRIDVYAEGFLKEWTPDDDPPPSKRNPGERLVDYLRRTDLPQQSESYAVDLANALSEPPKLNDKQWHRFAEWITKRRMSKDGHFLRVHFRTGATIDLVPEGSVASGCLLERGPKGKQSWRVVHPGLTRLWQEFQTQDAKRNGRG